MNLRNVFKYLLIFVALGGWGFSAIGQEQKAEEKTTPPPPQTRSLFRNPPINALNESLMKSQSLPTQPGQPNIRSGGWQNRPGGWQNENQNILNELNYLLLEIKSLLDSASLNTRPVSCEAISAEPVHAKLREAILTALVKLNQLTSKQKIQTQIQITQLEADHLKCALTMASQAIRPEDRNLFADPLAINDFFTIN